VSLEYTLPQYDVAKLPVGEPSQYGVGFPQVLLRLLATVEDWAVPRGAEHVHMQATLASLALRPQLAEGMLQVIHSIQCLVVHGALLHQWITNQDGAICSGGKPLMLMTRPRDHLICSSVIGQATR
jgi:hypothetical protein